jgi:hypothetical protein
MRDDRLHLTDSDLLRVLMFRAPGGPLSVRRLAAIAGISKTRMDDLLHDRYPTVVPDVANRIARAVGVHCAALFLPETSTSVDVDSRGGPVEHQRAVDADARRLVQELGHDEGPGRTDRGRASTVAPRPVRRAGPRDAPGRNRGADRSGR